MAIALMAANIWGQVTFLESSYELNMLQYDFSSGISIIDIDNDFINEIFLVNFTGRHRLYVRQGDVFADMGDYYGINGINNQYLNVTVADVNMDSLPDFYITGGDFGNRARLFINNAPNPFSQMASEYNLNMINSIGAAFFQLSPLHGLCILKSDRLMQYSDGSFVDITLGSGLENIENVFCPVFFDIDGDYDDDLFNAGNWELNFGALFRNNGDGTFTDISTNTNQGGFGFGQEVTFGDIDNDEDFDIYLCSGFGTNTMWQNDGTGYFTNITAQSGTGCGGYSRGASFADFDNDGDIDLFVNRSTEPKMLYLNDSTGVFTDVSQQSGVFLFGNGFGCSTGDINNDGQMDIMAANCCYDQNFIFINQNADTNFVKVKVKGRNTNTLALGAIIKLYAYDEGGRGFDFMAMREISSHSTLHGTNELTAHFGTRNASKLAVRVYFQSGAIAQMEGIDPGSTIVIEEPEVVSINDPGAELPSRILIARAYPNPFNNSIRISLVGGEAANYQIAIYNILGKKVRSDIIINNNPLTSFYTWNGCNDSGNKVGSGIYLININSGRRQATIKAILLQ
jgi:hypothetical protein